jgi:hypothetical protein
VTDAANKRKNALAHVAQALNDYAATLAPSVRGPYLAYTQECLNVIDPKPADPKAAE